MSLQLLEPLEHLRGVKAAVSIVLTNFLSVLHLVICSLLSTFATLALCNFSLFSESSLSAHFCFSSIFLHLACLAV